MSNEPNDATKVDVDTDDLDAFSDMFLNNNEKPEKEPQDSLEGSVPGDDDAADENDDEVSDEEGTEANSDEDNDPDEDGDDGEQKEEPKPKKTNRFQERINELTAKAREAERREAEIQRKLEELISKQQSESKPDPKPAAQTEAIVLPDPDAKNEDGSNKYPLGEFDPAYIRDLNRAIIEEERKAFREQEEQERNARKVQEARDALQEQWVEKLAPVTEQHEDFLDKTMQLESAFDGLDANYSDYLVQTIKSLDHGPEVLYYFANNLEEAKRVVQSGPLGATLALGEINAMFKGQSKKETKVSKAPPPPQVSVKGTSVKKTVAPDTDDLDAFSDVFFPKKRK